jgi:hypothetical protein
LFVPRQEEEDLRLKSIPVLIAVEVLEEGILFELFEDNACAKRFADHAREGRLPCADDPFDRYIAEVGLRSGGCKGFLCRHAFFLDAVAEVRRGYDDLI